MSEDVKVFLAQLDEANERYNLADAYYRGAPPEIMSNRNIKKVLGVEEGNFKENFSAIPVDAMTSRMRINAFYVPGEGQSKAATEYLSDLWIDSDMHTAIAGCIRDWNKYGEGYLEVALDELGNVDMCPSPVTKSQMVYSDRDLREKLFFGKLDYATRIVVNDVQELRVVTLKYSDRIERWIETGPDTNEFIPDYYVLDEEDNEVWEYHEYGQVPAFHFRNETPFGVSEHYQAYGAQDQIIKIIMNEMGVIDFAGLPQRWAITKAANGTANFNDGYGLPEKDEATLNINAGLENKGPGSMNIFEGVDAIGTFEAGNVEGFITAKESALRAMAVLTNTPIRFFSDPGGQHPSGESLRASDARFKDKILNREDNYGFTLASAFAFALELAGFAELEFPVVKWKPQAIDDSVDSLEIAAKKVNLGIPKYYVLIELGYAEDLVTSWGYSPSDLPEPNSVEEFRG